MTPPPLLPHMSGPAPTVLVVDDDRRVLDLLHLALTAHGYRVLVAADGDEALRLAAAERPDLVVLDVRLPKRSGHEVCQALRQDPDDPLLPIIMVSAAAETDARLQGLANGADDFMAKPFSPKELVARIRRHLARAREAREARRRGQEAERELERAREDAKRSHRELKVEQRLRELTAQLGRDLGRVLDVDELGRRLLFQVRAQLHADVVALLAPGPGGGALVPTAIVGEDWNRVLGVRIAPDGELAALLAGLGRPIARHDLERYPELGPELGPLIAGAFSWVAPLRGPEGLEGVLLLGERGDGRDWSRDDAEVLSTICETASASMRAALRYRNQIDAWLEVVALLATNVGESGENAAMVSRRADAAGLIQFAARHMMLSTRLREMVARCAGFGGWADREDGRRVLAAFAERDPTGRIAELARLLDPDAAPVMGADDADEALARQLVRVARAYAVALDSHPPREALDRALESAAEGPSDLRDVLGAALERGGVEAGA